MAGPPITPPPSTGLSPTFLQRMRSLFPPSWFPNGGDTTGTATSPTPVLDALMAGWSDGIATWIWWFLNYVQEQLYLTTATGGWLDIVSADYFGEELPRYPGESDTSFRARIEAALFAPANTRSAIQNALENLTGGPVRVIDPWQPNDTFVWNRSYWGVNTTTTPGQWSNGASRYQGFIQCLLPPETGGGSLSFWSLFFWGSKTYTAGWWSDAGVGFNAAELVYALINRLRVFGTVMWVQFTDPTKVGPPIVAPQPPLQGVSVFTRQEQPYHPQPFVSGYGAPFVRQVVAPVGRVFVRQEQPSHPLPRLSRGVTAYVAQVVPTAQNSVFTKQEQPFHPTSRTQRGLTSYSSAPMLPIDRVATRQEYPATHPRSWADQGRWNPATVIQTNGGWTIAVRQEQPWHPAPFLSRGGTGYAPISTYSGSSVFVRVEQPFHPASFVRSGT